MPRSVQAIQELFESRAAQYRSDPLFPPTESTGRFPSTLVSTQALIQSSSFHDHSTDVSSPKQAINHQQIESKRTKTQSCSPPESVQAVTPQQATLFHTSASESRVVGHSFLRFAWD